MWLSIILYDFKYNLEVLILEYFTILLLLYDILKSIKAPCPLLQYIYLTTFVNNYQQSK